MAGVAQVCCRLHPEAQLIEDFRSGDQICCECGLIVNGRAIDAGSEWRTFGSERCGGQASRVGGPENPLLCGSDLGTTIAGLHEGDSMNGRKKFQGQRNVENVDRILLRAFKEISAMGEQLGLSKTVMDSANHMFKEVIDKNSFKMRSKDAVASACLYISCRQDNIPRTFKEICAVSRVSRKEISRCFKLVLRSLGTTLEAISTDEFMRRFCTNLQLPPCIQEAAMEIAGKSVNMDLVPGRSPITVTAAAIYMASQASITKRNHKQISDVTGVAAGTIRQTYKLMYPRAEDLFPKDFNFDTHVEELPLC